MQVEGEIHTNPIANHAGWLRGPRCPHHQGTSSLAKACLVCRSCWILLDIVTDGNSFEQIPLRNPGSWCSELYVLLASESTEGWSTLIDHFNFAST